MPKIYIHAGLPKTGSSFLQNSFELLEKGSHFKNITYPFIQDHESFYDIHSGNASDIGQYLSPNLHPIFLKNQLYSKVDSLLEQVLDKNKTVVFSSEYFSTVPKDRAIIFKDYLEKKGYEVELIVVIRPLKELLFSAYMQNIKRDGSTLHFVDWIDNIAKRLPAFYIDNIMSYKVPVNVIKYNKVSLFEELLTLVGEDKNLHKISKKAIVNRSLTRNELNLLLNINSIFNNSHLTTKISDKLLKELPNKLPTKMTIEESLAFEKSIAKTIPPFDSYNDPTEKKIIDFFMLDSDHPNSLLAKNENENDKSIDQETLKLTLNVIKDHIQINSTPNFKGGTSELSSNHDSLHNICRPYVEKFRGISLQLKKHHLQLALDIMNFAQLGRPNGPVINKEIAQYKKLLNKSQSQEK